MGNKFYDGIIFRIPQICMPGSFMAKLCNNYGIGMALDPSDANFTNSLFEYYNSIKKEEFNYSCEKVLDKILREYECGCNIIKEYTNEIH